MCGMEVRCEVVGEDGVRPEEGSLTSQPRTETPVEAGTKHMDGILVCLVFGVSPMAVTKHEDGILANLELSVYGDVGIRHEDGIVASLKC
jgi:hypothetical protein